MFITSFLSKNDTNIYYNFRTFIHECQEIFYRKIFEFFTLDGYLFSRYNENRQVIELITLSKIAKLANVSVSTASKAFSGSAEVSEATRDRIFEIAKQNNCFKKFYNAKYSKYVISILCPEFTSAYYNRYLSFIQKNLEKENCEICVASTGFSAETEKNLVEYYNKHARVDGIIIIGSRLNPADSHEYPSEIPIVYIDAQHEHDTTTISDTLSDAFNSSIDYLIQKNVTAIGFIGEQKTLSKIQHFRNYVTKQGIQLNEDHIVVSDGRFEAGGYTAMEQIFKSGTLPRAILCAYDYMAIGAIRCILDHGLSVPEDIAILGINDIPEAAFLNPPLASISSHTKEMCQAAASSIIRRINGEETEKKIVFPSEFILRKSFEIE